jgi:quinol monooxygenase YgiN
MSEKVTVFASFHPNESSRDDFLALMEMMIVHTRREPGNEVYDLYADAEGGYHLFEIYSDQDALQAHRDADHYKHYRANVVDMLEGGIGVVVLSAIDAVN